ncbi:MAG: hypothetical protein ABSD29_04300 [Verrucomicrobiota bacterium]
MQAFTRNQSGISAGGTRFQGLPYMSVASCKPKKNLIANKLIFPAESAR